MNNNTIPCTYFLKMKNILLVIALFFNSNMHSQIYQHFIFKPGTRTYDTEKQQLAEKAINFYYSANYDSAIFYYSELINSDTNYYQAYYNLAKCYIKKGDTHNAIINASKYVNFSKQNCKCSFFKDALFNDVKNDTSFVSTINKCRQYFNEYVAENKIQNPELLLAIQYYDAKEQEILGNRVISKNERDSLLYNNFSLMFSNIDTVHFPDKKAIGNGTSLIQIMVLHMDYKPALQYYYGVRMLQMKNKNYNKKMSAYIVDRALKNMNRPQLYGTILVKNENNQSVLYQVDNHEKMIKRRKKLKFQPIEEYLKNKSITK